MHHLVLGYGEIGHAIAAYLLEDSTCSIEVYDKNMGYDYIASGSVDVLHVCIPYSEKFHEIVMWYKNMALKASGIVIVHGTVDVGTCRKLGAVYSPCRGVHPNILQGLKTFVKFFAGDQAVDAAEIFANLGCNVRVHTGHTAIEDLEALKLWDTTQYGWQIILMHLMKSWCDEKGLNFSMIYTEANKTYNEGYVKLGRPEVVRPYLKFVPGPIGGHCVIPNCKILNDAVSKIILDCNEQIIKEGKVQQ